jgi:glutamate dehydrogenase
MPSSVEVLRVDLIDQLEHMARLRITGPEQTLTTAFVRALYQNLPPADLVNERPEALLDSALALLKFADERAPAQAKVRLRQDPGSRRRTLLEIVNDDMPFLVDSVRSALHQVGLEVRLIVHPILSVVREHGRLVRVRGVQERSAEAGPTWIRESVMQVWLGRFPEDWDERVVAGVLGVLTDVRTTLEDATRVRALVEELARTRRHSERAEEREAGAFLHWLLDDHFVFVGARGAAQAHGGHAHGGQANGGLEGASGLGVLRNPARQLFSSEPTLGAEALQVLKADVRSTVLQNVPLDVIRVGAFANEGRSEGSGPYWLAGLFTAAADSCLPATIPMVRAKLDAVVERAAFAPGSHDDRLLRSILETYPRDELFQISAEDLYSIGLGIFHLQHRPRAALFLRRDPLGRFVSCLVYVPSDRMNPALGSDVQRLLSTTFRGEVTEFNPQLSDAPLARWRVLLRTASGVPAGVDYQHLERRLEVLARSWAERLQIALPAELGEEEGARLALSHVRTFPASYRESHDEFEAAFDVAAVEQALTSGQLAVRLDRRTGEPDYALRLKIFSPEGGIALSDVLPILENMGLRVVNQAPFELKPTEAPRPVWLHELSVEMADRARVNLDAVSTEFVSAFTQIWRKELESDGFNPLILQAGLTAREVLLLRTYGKYLRRLQVPFSLAYLQQTLRQQASLTALLVELFHRRLSPTRADAVQAEALRVRLLGGLDALTSLDQDRILRLFLELVLATVRTNFYQRGPDGALKSHVALKLDPHAIGAVPQPRPYREIFVSGPRTEGVHLRFGAIARGGLRWSDRLEDFRTEVLGLVKAQQVKNAVIVPVGAKGGFVLKQPPPESAGRDALRAEAVACYQIFVSSLLDLTDNVETSTTGAAVDPSANRSSMRPSAEQLSVAQPSVARPSSASTPERTVALDGHDPYFVVAADKGTATFSDVANAIAQARGFWLGDAFASGGSNGYDHKAMAITARGAWESVKRHFAELNLDVQSQDFTCVGVGDMSGDVFGNGMLRSRHLRLIAAFDHRHVFLDPDPDPAQSFEERERLSRLERSSWADYDAKRLSPGGGVFARTLKRIELSAAIRARLGINETSLAPNELIGAVLRAPVDLLFFGGIGTYVKAPSEAHAQVGDPSNDGLRVSGRELRARVVAEGANLGMTQLGRVDYALRGGRCNTDFIDNSGGVDCSDHEVNLKILLADVERSGQLTRNERNQLLREVTGELAELVLRDNTLQTQCLSLCEQLSTGRVFALQRRLTRERSLDPALEFLPEEADLQQRARDGKGYTRPELCVLLAYRKNSLRAELLQSELLVNDPLLARDLEHYFPTPVVARFPEAARRHRLQREIKATVLCNEFVNRMGLVFASETQRTLSTGSAELALGYRYAREIVDAPALWAAIEGLDSRVPARVRYELLHECSRLIGKLTVSLLRDPSDRWAGHWERYRAAHVLLERYLLQLQRGPEQQAAREQAARWEAVGVPAALAERVASLRGLHASVDLARVAERGRIELERAAEAHVAVGAALGLDWLLAASDGLASDREWDRQARDVLVDELLVTQSTLTLSVLSGTPMGTVEEGLRRWIAAHQAAVDRLLQLLVELKTAPALEASMLLLASRQLRLLSP